MRRFTFRLFLTFALAAPADLFAQTYQGGLRGAVRDADGVVPGANVVLINEETGFERTVVSNDAGEFAFPNLVPGSYTLRASIAGFKTFESRGLRVGTQDFLTIDLPLEPGEVQEAITVTGATPVIETTTASVATLIDRQTLESLPNASVFRGSRARAPGRMAASVGYVGSRCERLTVGGTIDARVKINQLDSRFLAMGTALQELVPNPFFNISAFGARAISPTIPRGDLLRPYPQFVNVFAPGVPADAAVAGAGGVVIVAN